MDAPDGLDVEANFDGWRCRADGSVLTANHATLEVDGVRAAIGDVTAMAMDGRLVLVGGVDASLVMPDAHVAWLVSAIRRMQRTRERQGVVPDALASLRGDDG